MLATPMHEPLSDDELRRYSRHLKLAEIGQDGQARLKAARVLLVGAGGLGSPAALYLAAAGVGTLGLVDYDTVDESNLQRQVLFDTASVGQLKTRVARARLEALNPGTRVVAHAVELCAANVRALFCGYDLVIDGSDRLGTRYLVNDACVLYGKPLVSAAIHRFEGQIMVYVPGRGPCYRCLFPHPAEGLVPNCADVGVLGVLPGVLGTLAATEAIKLIVGAGTPLIGRLLTYDALELRFSEFRFARRPDCAVCGAHPSILAPADPRGFLHARGAGARSTVAAARARRGAGHGIAAVGVDRRARAGRVRHWTSGRSHQCAGGFDRRPPGGAAAGPNVGVSVPQRCAQPQGLRARAARRAGAIAARGRPCGLSD